MTDAEQREAARQFKPMDGKRKEDEDGRSYWIDLLTNVLGMDNVTERLNPLEKKVVIEAEIQNVLMCIPETRVIIEQKSLGKALDQKIRIRDAELNSFEQADRYIMES